MTPKAVLDIARAGELWASVKTLVSGKQSKLTGKSGQVVGFHADGSAAAVDGWSNPNLLDNWYFADPINQRGKTKWTAAAKPETNADANTEYEFTGGYTVDRWVSGNVSAELTSEGMKMTGASWYSGLNQYLEPQLVNDLIGKTMTFSVLYKSVAGCIQRLIVQDTTLNKSLTAPYPSTKDASVTLASTIFTFTEENRNHRIYVGFTPTTNISSNPNYYSTLIAAKLELGPVQTLAHQDADGNWVLNDPPPNKALELAKCQRYQIELANGNSYYVFFTGVALSATQINADLILPCALTKAPTLATSNISDFTLYPSAAFTSVKIYKYKENVVQITVTGTDFEVGKSYMFGTKNTNSAIFLLDANL